MLKGHRNHMRNQAKYLPHQCGSDMTRIPCTKTLIDWMKSHNMPGGDSSSQHYCIPGSSVYLKDLRDNGMIDPAQPSLKAAFLPAAFFNEQLYDKAVKEVPEQMERLNNLRGDNGDLAFKIWTGMSKMSDATGDWGWWGPSDLKNGDYDADYWKANGQNWPEWLTNPTSPTMNNKGYGWPQCTDYSCSVDKVGPNLDYKDCDCTALSDCSAFCGDAWKTNDPNRQPYERVNPVEWGLLGERQGAEDCGALTWTKVGRSGNLGPTWSMMSLDCGRTATPTWDAANFLTGTPGVDPPMGALEDGDYHNAFPMCMVMYPAPEPRPASKKSCKWQQRWNWPMYTAFDPDTYAEAWIKNENPGQHFRDFVIAHNQVGSVGCGQWFTQVPPSPPPVTYNDWLNAGRMLSEMPTDESRQRDRLADMLETGQIEIDREHENLKRLRTMQLESDGARKRYTLQVVQHYANLDVKYRSAAKRRLFSTNPGGVIGNEQLPNNQNLIVADVDNTGSMDLIVHSYAPSDGDCTMRCNSLGRFGYQTFTLDDAEVEAATDMYCFCGPKLESYEGPNPPPNPPKPPPEPPSPPPAPTPPPPPCPPPDPP
jgi:hypothetical protein